TSSSPSRCPEPWIRPPHPHGSGYSSRHIGHCASPTPWISSARKKSFMMAPCRVALAIRLPPAVTPTVGMSTRFARHARHGSIQRSMAVLLVTNDDGVHAAGLTALADALVDLGDVHVLAPEREQSACGHA